MGRMARDVGDKILPAFTPPLVALTVEPRRRRQHKKLRILLLAPSLDAPAMPPGQSRGSFLPESPVGLCGGDVQRYHN